MSDTNATQSLEYWAVADTKTCADAVSRKIAQYYQYLNTVGLMAQWGTTYRFYHGGRVSQGVVNAGGQEGEYRTMNVNHFRNLILHIKQLVISQRPAWEPRAINSDVKSQKQTILARGILDYYLREKRVERDLDTATEYALIFGEGFIHTRWNATDGKVWATDPDTGVEKREGDVKSSAYEPVDVIRDPLLQQYRDRNWLILRDRVSKYELAAKYPEFAEKIIAYQEKVNQSYHYRSLSNVQAFDTDLVTLYTLYHAKTDACPDGRQMEIIEDDLVLTDGPLAYSKMPVHREAANEVFGSPFGYTVAYDLSALQESYDYCVSIIKSNQEMFGVQNVIVPEGGGYNVVDMGGQLKFIQGDYQAGKPEALNLLATPAEVYNFLKTIEMMMQTISGINDVTRGTSPGADTSGAALALLQSMSIQFNQALQAGYVRIAEDVGTAMIELLKDYAAVPRMMAIAGKYNRSFFEEFSGEDLSNIDRIIVDIGNPLLQTTAGKVQIAQTMLQAGFIKMPDELLQVINTGSLQPMIQGKTMELLQLAQENEVLKEGGELMAIITDDHALHINEHKSVLADPESRMDPKISEATLTHLQQHIDLLKSPQYQELLGLMGQPALGAPPQGPASQGGPQGMPPAPGPGAVGQDVNAQVQSMQPNQPGMPKNALSGKPFNTQTGGLQ